MNIYKNPEHFQKIKEIQENQGNFEKSEKIQKHIGTFSKILEISKKSGKFLKICWTFPKKKQKHQNIMKSASLGGLEPPPDTAKIHYPGGLERPGYRWRQG